MLAGLCGCPAPLNESSQGFVFIAPVVCLPAAGGLQVRLKDERLRQLRGAIKALEGKLAQLLKDKTDL